MNLHINFFEAFNNTFTVDMDLILRFGRNYFFKCLLNSVMYRTYFNSFGKNNSQQALP